MYLRLLMLFVIYTRIYLIYVPYINKCMQYRSPTFFFFLMDTLAIKDMFFFIKMSHYFFYINHTIHKKIQQGGHVPQSMALTVVLIVSLIRERLSKKMLNVFRLL